MDKEKIYGDAYRYAVKNAFFHNGKAELKAVVGKVLALHKDADAKKVMPLLQEVVEKVNSLSEKALREEYTKFEEGYELKPQEKTEDLPQLDWALDKRVVTRYAPNPNGPFHLGNARAAIISHEYARKYKGKFLLRFDDTDPKIKKPIANAEKIFLEDLKWLGITPDEVYFASDRLEKYYEYMRKIVEMGKGYVCVCKSEEWREKIKKHEGCECRDLDVKEQKKRLGKMFKHEYKEGEAVLRIKTDLSDKDPSLRDWWAAKIVDMPEHARVGDKYNVWPSYNFASAIDDHELGITLILRGQEHTQNMDKQKFLYNYFGWEYPHAFHFGRLKLEGFVLSTSKIAEGIEKGEFEGWDDPQLGTIQALRRRGFSAETIKDIIMELGVNPVDATIQMKKLVDLNKKHIDSRSERITYLEDPYYLDVQYMQELEVEKDKHKYVLKSGVQRFIVSKKEIEKIGIGKIFRLRNACNVRLMRKDEMQGFADFVGTGMIKTTVVSWILEPADVEIKMPDKSLRKGILDEKIWKMKFNKHVFLEKFGYAMIDALEQGEVKLWFTHK